jgi:nuclease-like protein
MVIVPSLHIGTAGASARRKAERLRQEREQLRSTRSGLARLLACLFPSDTEKRLQKEERDYAAGAEGELILARSLARRCPDVPMLNDRRAPMRQGNIDHIVIAPTGVYVIDCKRYKGKIQVARPLFGRTSLKINRRNRTRLLEGLDRHVADVKAAVAGLADDVPVHGCLCFVAPAGLLSDIGLPILRTLMIDGYALYYPRRLATRLNRRGALTAERAKLLHAELAKRLPPALTS